MAQLQGPLLSLQAHGAYAHALIYRQTKSGPQALVYHAPIKSNAPGLVRERQTMQWLGESWKRSPIELRAPFLAYKSIPKLNSWAEYMRTNISTLFHEGTVRHWEVAPAPYKGPVSGQTAISNTGTTLHVRAEHVDLPPGWREQSMETFAIQSQDPHQPPMSGAVLHVSNPNPLAPADLQLPGPGTYQIATYIHYRDNAGGSIYAARTSQEYTIP